MPTRAAAPLLPSHPMFASLRVAEGDHGIAHDKHGPRFPCVSTLSRSRYLPPHPYSDAGLAAGTAHQTALRRGALCGLLLCGLSPSAYVTATAWAHCHGRCGAEAPGLCRLPVLQAFLDRTGDLQTVTLLISNVSRRGETQLGGADFLCAG